MSKGLYVNGVRVRISLKPDPPKSLLEFLTEDIRKFQPKKRITKEWVNDLP